MNPFQQTYLLLQSLDDRVKAKQFLQPINVRGKAFNYNNRTSAWSIPWMNKYPVARFDRWFLDNSSVQKGSFVFVRTRTIDRPATFEGAPIVPYTTRPIARGATPKVLRNNLPICLSTRRRVPACFLRLRQFASKKKQRVKTRRKDKGVDE